MNESARITIERRYRGQLGDIWALWTTAEGIEAWWGPPGFAVTVDKIDLRAGGRFDYTMTAVTPEMVGFMKRNGLPVATPTRSTFEAVEPMRRLAWRQLVDFIPGQPPYETRLEVQFDASGGEVTIRLGFEPMHDAEWTGRQRAGWGQQLDRLAALVATPG